MITEVHRPPAFLKISVTGNDIYLHTGTPVHPVSPLTKVRQMRVSDPGII